MADLPPPGIYGPDTGVNPNPQTPFSPVHPMPDVPPSKMPHQVLRQAILRMLK